MASCSRCGVQIGMFQKFCSDCKKLNEQEVSVRRSLAEERRREEQQRLTEEKTRAEYERKLELERRIESKVISLIESNKADQRIFIYKSVHLPVDSIVMNNPLSDFFDISPIHELGLLGWDIVQSVPRTMGMGLTNESVGSTFGNSWGGGLGGNVIGVYLLLKKELCFKTNNDSYEELREYVACTGSY
jgi:hypothetical protein